MIKPRIAAKVRAWRRRLTPRHISVSLMLMGAAVLVFSLVFWVAYWFAPSAVPPARQYPVAVVQITPQGFSPQSLSVAPGTKVVWVNTDSRPHLVAADPYPTHAELPALVAPRALGQRETYSFIFTKPRTVHYHDDLNPTLGGVIIVR